jgi:LacI family transcriptional regulator
MSVIGFDDVMYTAQMSPPLTTIHQPLVEIGKTAVNMLLRLIAGQQLESNHVELSTSLVVRKSCAPPRSGPLARHAATPEAPARVGRTRDSSPAPSNQIT